MSSFDTGQRRRVVVPRWRSFLNTPSPEIVTENRFPAHEPITGAAFRDLIQIWRRDRGAADAVDIMDAGIAAGSRQLAVEGAKRVLAFGHAMQPRVVEQANAILFSRVRHLAVSSAPSGEQNVNGLREKIARIKVILRESPRNPLGHVEMARLYSRLAQFDKADHHIKSALILAPDDRFVLRVATRFYTMIGESVDALRALWKSDATKYDPWLMSAELAAAMASRRSTQFAHKGAKRLKAAAMIDRGHSELAAGWVSKLHSEGASTKQTLKDVARVLRNPTENALAQSVWLTDHLGRKFVDTFPQAQFAVDAHEARSLALSEAGEYEAAEAATKAWFLDQPFQARASIELSHLYFVHLRRYSEALSAAEAGLVIHSDDWLLINLATISSIKIGHAEKTANYIRKLESLTDNDERRSFLSAAHGMRYFERGDLAVAVKKYFEAAAFARKSKKADLLVTAYVFMVEQAFVHKILSASEYPRLKEEFDKAIRRLPPEMRGASERMWHSRSQVILECISRENYQEDFTPLLATNDILADLAEG
jgi:tetratricopeptide (TPR) repeat protein